MHQSNSIGKTCPYCLTTITEDQEAVYCSICEMPHHKECWIENKGCTTFGCMGTMVDDINSDKGISQAKSQENLFCSKCGTSFEAGQRFCVVCGSALQTPAPTLIIAAAPDDLPSIDIDSQPIAAPVTCQQPRFEQQSGYGAGVETGSRADNDQDLILFIGSNQPYYLNQFHVMNVKSTKTSWNWCAFLFSVYWMAYRKMYKLAAIILVVVSILAMIPVIGTLVAIGVSVAIGILGNYLYMTYVEEELRMARTLESSQAILYIHKKGGTSIGGMFAVMGIYILALMVIFISIM